MAKFWYMYSILDCGNTEQYELSMLETGTEELNDYYEGIIPHLSVHYYALMNA